MTPSPFTLAASVTSALPGSVVVGAQSVDRDDDARFHSAIVALEDGRRLLVRAPVDDEAAAELAADTQVLRSLSPGLRALLPFRIPNVLGEGLLGERRTVVTDVLDGYRVEAPDIPPGPGVADSIGRTLAAIHSLPTTVIRSEGLTERDAEETRAQIRMLVERAAATRRLPVTLAVRWQQALDDDALWQFEPRPVLGDAAATSFLLGDEAGVPVVTGVIGWQRFGIGDPASDLHWLTGAPDAEDSVLSVYAGQSDRALDRGLRVRARLYAELEFARWLLHGHTLRRDDIVNDAVDLLDALVEGLGSDPTDLRASLSGGVDEAIEVLAEVQVPPSASDEPVTAMQTDTYDPDMLSLFEASESDAGDPDRQPEQHPDGTVEGDQDISEEVERASRAAIHRWTTSDSE